MIIFTVDYWDNLIQVIKYKLIKKGCILKALILLTSVQNVCSLCFLTLKIVPYDILYFSCRMPIASNELSNYNLFNIFYY